jgi:hypothetical protein
MFLVPLSVVSEFQPSFERRCAVAKVDDVKIGGCRRLLCGSAYRATPCVIGVVIVFDVCKLLAPAVIHFYFVAWKLCDVFDIEYFIHAIAVRRKAIVNRDLSRLGAATHHKVGQLYRIRWHSST